MIELADLRDLHVFTGVSDAALSRAATRAADVRVDAGQWLVREGEAGAFYVLLSGTYTLVKKYLDGEHELATRTDAGEYLGELPIIFGTAFFAGARAVTPLRVARFDRLAFGLLIRESQALRDEIARTVQVRVEGLEYQAIRSLSMPVVLGGQHDPACHSIRDFLSRNQVVYEWGEPDDPWIADRPELGAAIAACTPGPVVLFPDGTLLHQPTPGEVAEQAGLCTDPAHDSYDVVIVGGGPAGLAAAVYGASEGLKTLLVEREATGGQAGTSSRIENYLGFPSGVSGDDLASRAREQAIRLGAEIVVTRKIERMVCADDCHTVTLDGGREIVARAAILAIGVQYRTLVAEGLDSCVGVGVFYGASRNEAAAMQGKDVILVGGGNSAGQAAMFFSDYAKHVTILVRGAGLAASMSRYLIDELERKANVHVRTGGEIVSFDGGPRLDAVTIRNRADGSSEVVQTDGVFIFIGAEAVTGWLPEQLVRDERGYICTGRDVIDLGNGAWPLPRDPYLLETSVPGVFAAGDVRHGSIKRVASGVGEGSIAIAFVHEHLAEVASRRGERTPADGLTPAI